jgi:hypothetical protein
VKKVTVRVCGDLKAHLDCKEMRIEETEPKFDEDEFEWEAAPLLEESHEQKLDAVA